jgi:hypothetical protein
MTKKMTLGGMDYSQAIDEAQDLFTHPTGKGSGSWGPIHVGEAAPKRPQVTVRPWKDKMKTLAIRIRA